MSESISQAFVEVCAVDELWSGEMACFDVGTRKVLILNADGQLHSYDGKCPHQSTPLVEGRFEGNVLTCRAHEWTFDACTGKGINPKGVCLRRFPLQILGGRVFVAMEATEQ